MSYHLDFTDKANEDIAYFKKIGNKAILRKIATLLLEITEHPFTGTGKPEALRYDFAGLWSRRINHEHRLIYEIQEDKVVIIIAAKGHYS